MARQKRFNDGINQLNSCSSNDRNCIVYLADRLIPILPRLLPKEQSHKSHNNDWPI
ncbi:MAG: hypothetical protein JXB20_00170 [Bacilli bacterium]|nr:hypothetical protein [Bacilli bacterium]MBN2696212.1 hypothetical protein [Bacilli bacterium]